ncbi:hypothetical protein ACL02V_28935 [Bacillus mobilis]|uniref:Uncharacterized protein n=1 Tax=Bacillus cereus TaxID=1396 RepID=A0A9X7CPC3_BACCE|nr:hypothetical protein [Bacillus cereus]KAA6448208.1 hypothetical protein DX932_31980 [Bacillus cereus]PGS80262.1 hypothetical protein COC69_10025 [Bacillus cereus]
MKKVFDSQKFMNSILENKILYKTPQYSTGELKVATHLLNQDNVFDIDFNTITDKDINDVIEHIHGYLFDRGDDEFLLEELQHYPNITQNMDLYDALIIANSDNLIFQLDNQYYAASSLLRNDINKKYNLDDTQEIFI